MVFFCHGYVLHSEDVTATFTKYLLSLQRHSVYKKGFISFVAIEIYSILNVSVPGVLLCIQSVLGI